MKHVPTAASGGYQVEIEKLLMEIQSEQEKKIDENKKKENTWSCLLIGVVL